MAINLRIFRSSQVLAVIDTLHAVHSVPSTASGMAESRVGIKHTWTWHGGSTASQRDAWMRGSHAFPHEPFGALTTSHGSPVGPDRPRRTKPELRAGLLRN